jgi:alpha-ribazole phosphatase
VKTFYLVRHAQYANPRKILVGRLPVVLSDEGVKEAEKLADFFADKKITQIYSSPVVRCKQTSEIIANREIPLTCDIRIAETLSAYQGYWEYDWAHFYERTKNLGGEMPQDVQNRTIKFWEDIKDEKKDSVIICSHGDPLYLLYAHLAKIATPNIKEIYEIRDDKYQPKASVRKVTYDKGEVAVGPIIKVGEL